MIELKINVDTRRFEREVAAFLKDQIPFATARALTLTAKDAERDVEARLPDVFTLRGKGLERGIRIEPATKRGLVSRIGSLDPFMERQSEGGIKRGRDGGSVAVPANKGEAARLRKRTTPRTRWPGAELAKPRTFLAPMPGTGGKLGVWRRRGKRRLPLLLLYTIAPEVRVEARWKFRQQVEASVARNFERRWRETMEAAAATRR